MYLGPEMKFQAANVVKNRTDMFTVLASRVTEGQQTEKQNYNTGRKRVNWRPQVLLVCLIATWIVTRTFRKIRLLSMLLDVTNQLKTNLELAPIISCCKIFNREMGSTTTTTQTQSESCEDVSTEGGPRRAENKA